MDFLFPVHFKLEGRRCAVVGGGKIGQRKALALAKAGAHVVVISPTLTAPLRKALARGVVTHIARDFRASDLRGAMLVVAATGAEEINSKVATAARKAAVPCNVVDAPELCDFYVPAVLRRGNLCVSVSTDGLSPAFARAVKEILDGQFGPRYDRIVRLASKYRKIVKDRLRRKRDQRDFWKWLAASGIPRAGKERRIAGIERRVRRRLSLR